MQLGLMIPGIHSTCLYEATADNFTRENRKGPIPGVLLILKSIQEMSGCHIEINNDNSMRWINKKLLPNAVVYTASQSMLRGRYCTSSSRKTDMEDWLLKYKILFNIDLLTIELYNLIKLHKPRQKRHIFMRFKREWT
jgi:hypothetical protein